jgi:hypothetical protein
MRGEWDDECDQNTLDTRMQLVITHNETHCFVQLIHANEKIEGIVSSIWFH